MRISEQAIADWNIQRLCLSKRLNREVKNDILIRRLLLVTAQGSSRQNFSSFLEIPVRARLSGGDDRIGLHFTSEDQDESSYILSLMNSFDILFLI